ncbi:MAG: ABC transporter permease [Candidatus Paceibacterota bacterium]|jgi:NitT/TauT family transport system permease protein
MNILSWLKKNYISFISILVFFVLWEAIARFNFINPLFISSPSKIYKSGSMLVLSGEIFPHVWISLKAFFAGFLAGIVLGVLGGLAIGYNKYLYKIFLPYVLALNSLPTIAIIPLVIIWFGIGIEAKIIIVLLMVIKPILINTINAVINTDRNIIKMAKSFGASHYQILSSIVFFSALPFIFSSLQMAIGRGITGLVVGEMFGYGKGLGFLVSFYGNTFQTPRLMFVVTILLVISLTMSRAVHALEGQIIKWKN